MSNQSGVYVKDKTYGWLPAQISSRNESSATVLVSIPQHEYASSTQVTKEQRIVPFNEYEDGTLPLQNVLGSGSLMVVADMCDLPSLHEAAILYNLKERHEQKEPYTRVGDIVIAMNPFQWIEELYTPERRELYVDKLILNGDPNGDSKAGLEPHVYEVSSLAYRGLAMDSQHQSILVSGESGAGKTETVKIVMSHLASVQEGNDSTTHQTSQSNVVKRVLDSNPLLEAFGNAKTARNDNSSRFGKYIQLQFDVEDPTTAAFGGKKIPSCVLAGSTCETYLLEKSRVVGHEESERGFHIFYQLLAAPESVRSEIWEGLCGKDNASFRYVGATDTTTIENRPDGDRWHSTIEALALVGIADEKLKDLMRALCVVLQLGNLDFDIDPENDDGSVITSLEELLLLSKLMEVGVEDIQKALTFRTLVTAKDKMSVPLRAGMAKDSCDAFAKEIYNRVFDWLVKAINEATSAEKNYDDASEVEQYGNIGLLDIFGFESFVINRFEQFCINYANEKLQQKYNLDIFQSVEEEYKYEGIPLSDVSIEDNAHVLNLIEGRMGLVSVLNEECLRPHGNDSSFVSKAKTINKDIDCLVKNPLHRPTEFAVSHYAGDVKYDAQHFVQKNTDNLPVDLIECACMSSNKLINTELKEASLIKGSSRGKSSKHTVTSKFRSQLHSLMEIIGRTRSRYIRCIKPNPEKSPLITNLGSTVGQLKCAGVVAAVTISRVAYPNRLTHENTMERFLCLSEKSAEFDEDEDSQNAVTRLMVELLGSFDLQNKKGERVSAFACGKSRIYFKAGALEQLEARRMAKLGVLASSIQRIVRGFIAKSVFTRLKTTAINMQALARRKMARSGLLEAQAATTTLSCWIRIVFAKAKLLNLQRNKACITIQTRCRIVIASNYLNKCKLDAVEIQKIWRGALQRPKLIIMLEEAREDARVNSKLSALQKRLQDAEMKWIKAEKARIAAEKRAESGMSTPKSSPSIVTDFPNQEEEKEEQNDDQMALIDESTKMLEYLRKQVFEMRSKNFLLRSDLDEVKHANQNMAEHYTSITASYEVLRQQNEDVVQKNKQLLTQSFDHKKQLAQAKRDLKKIQQDSDSELKKVKALMKAKDKDHALEIDRMQAEIATKRLANGMNNRDQSNKKRTGRYTSSKNSKRSPTGKNDRKDQSFMKLERASSFKSQSSSVSGKGNDKKKSNKKSSGKNDGQRSGPPSRVNSSLSLKSLDSSLHNAKKGQKSRANFGKSSPEKALFGQTGSADAADTWGNDQYQSMYNESSAVSQNKKAPSRNKSKTQKKKSTEQQKKQLYVNTNSSLGQRTLNGDDTTTPNKTKGSTVVSPSSSLASAVKATSPPSSLNKAKSGGSSLASAAKQSK